MSRIEPWSTYRRTGMPRSSEPAIHGRSNWPAMNGMRSCSTIFQMPFSDELEPAFWFVIVTLTITGVRKMPIRLEADALHTAAGTLPLAIDVKAIDDCTVDGSVHRNRTPVYSAGVTSGASTGLSARPSSGNSTNVLSRTTRCRRQCVAPATIAPRGNLAPCRKNSRLIEMFAIKLTVTAVCPRQGSRLAAITVATSASVKLPGNRLGLARRMSFNCCNFADDKAHIFSPDGQKNPFM